MSGMVHVRAGQATLCWCGYLAIQKCRNGLAQNRPEAQTSAKDIKGRVVVGSTHRAHCKCGFETEVTVGGSRAEFLENSKFPYYCANCGIVSVNIAKLETGDKPPCPNCNGAEIHQYGLPPVSIPLPPPKPIPRPKARGPFAFLFGRTPVQAPPEVGAPAPVRENRRTLQWDQYEANEFENLCPACKQMTMVFNTADVMFD